MSAVARYNGGLDDKHSDPKPGPTTNSRVTHRDVLRGRMAEDSKTVEVDWHYNTTLRHALVTMKFGSLSSHDTDFDVPLDDIKSFRAMMNTSEAQQHIEALAFIAKESTGDSKDRDLKDSYVEWSAMHATTAPHAVRLFPGKVTVYPKRSVSTIDVHNSKLYASFLNEKIDRLDIKNGPERTITDVLQKVISTHKKKPCVLNLQLDWGSELSSPNFAAIGTFMSARCQQNLPTVVSLNLPIHARSKDSNFPPCHALRDLIRAMMDGEPRDNKLSNLNVTAESAVTDELTPFDKAVSLLVSRGTETMAKSNRTQFSLEPLDAVQRTIEKYREDTIQPVESLEDVQIYITNLSTLIDAEVEVFRRVVDNAPGDPRFTEYDLALHNSGGSRVRVVTLARECFLSVYIIAQTNLNSKLDFRAFMNSIPTKGRKACFCNPISVGEFESADTLMEFANNSDPVVLKVDIPKHTQTEAALAPPYDMRVNLVHMKDRETTAGRQSVLRNDIDLGKIREQNMRMGAMVAKLEAEEEWFKGLHTNYVRDIDVVRNIGTRRDKATKDTYVKLIAAIGATAMPEQKESYASVETLFRKVRLREECAANNRCRLLLEEIMRLEVYGTQQYIEKLNKTDLELFVPTSEGVDVWPPQVSQYPVTYLQRKHAMDMLSWYSVHWMRKYEEAQYQRMGLSFYRPEINESKVFGFETPTTGKYGRTWGVIRKGAIKEIVSSIDSFAVKLTPSGQQFDGRVDVKGHIEKTWDARVLAMLIALYVAFMKYIIFTGANVPDGLLNGKQRLYNDAPTILKNLRDSIGHPTSRVESAGEIELANIANGAKADTIEQQVFGMRAKPPAAVTDRLPPGSIQGGFYNSAAKYRQSAYEQEKKSIRTFHPRADVFHMNKSKLYGMKPADFDKFKWPMRFSDSAKREHAFEVHQTRQAITDVLWVVSTTPDEEQQDFVRQAAVLEINPATGLSTYTTRQSHDTVDVLMASGTATAISGLEQHPSILPALNFTIGTPDEKSANHGRFTWIEPALKWADIVPEVRAKGVNADRILDDRHDGNIFRRDHTIISGLSNPKTNAWSCASNKESVARRGVSTHPIIQFQLDWDCDLRFHPMYAAATMAVYAANKHSDDDPTDRKERRLLTFAFPKGSAGKQSSLDKFVKVLRLTFQQARFDLHDIKPRTPPPADDTKQPPTDVKVQVQAPPPLPPTDVKVQAVPAPLTAAREEKRKEENKIPDARTAFEMDVFRTFGGRSWADQDEEENPPPPVAIHRPKTTAVARLLPRDRDRRDAQIVSTRDDIKLLANKQRRDQEESDNEYLRRLDEKWKPIENYRLSMIREPQNTQEQTAAAEVAYKAVLAKKAAELEARRTELEIFNIITYHLVPLGHQYWITHKSKQNHGASDEFEIAFMRSHYSNTTPKVQDFTMEEKVDQKIWNLDKMPEDSNATLELPPQDPTPTTKRYGSSSTRALVMQKGRKRDPEEQRRRLVELRIRLLMRKYIRENLLDYGWSIAHRPIAEAAGVILKSGTMWHLAEVMFSMTYMFMTRQSTDSKDSKSNNYSNNRDLAYTWWYRTFLGDWTTSKHFLPEPENAPRLTPASWHAVFEWNSDQLWKLYDASHSNERPEHEKAEIDKWIWSKKHVSNRDFYKPWMVARMFNRVFGPHTKEQQRTTLPTDAESWREEIIESSARFNALTAHEYPVRPGIKGSDEYKLLHKFSTQITTAGDISKVKTADEVKTLVDKIPDEELPLEAFYFHVRFLAKLCCVDQYSAVPPNTSNRYTELSQRQLIELIESETKRLGLSDGLNELTKIMKDFAAFHLGQFGTHNYQHPRLTWHRFSAIMKDLVHVQSPNDNDDLVALVEKVTSYMAGSRQAIIAVSYGANNSSRKVVIQSGFIDVTIRKERALTEDGSSGFRHHHPHAVSGALTPGRMTVYEREADAIMDAFNASVVTQVSNAVNPIPTDRSVFDRTVPDIGDGPTVKRLQAFLDKVQAFEKTDAALLSLAIWRVIANVKLDMNLRRHVREQNRVDDLPHHDLISAEFRARLQLVLGFLDQIFDIGPSADLSTAAQKLYGNPHVGWDWLLKRAVSSLLQINLSLIRQVFGYDLVASEKVYDWTRHTHSRMVTAPLMIVRVEKHKMWMVFVLTNYPKLSKEQFKELLYIDMGSESDVHVMYTTPGDALQWKWQRVSE